LMSLSDIERSSGLYGSCNDSVRIPAHLSTCH